MRRIFRMPLAGVAAGLLPLTRYLRARDRRTVAQVSERLFDADWYARANDLRPFPSARAHYVARGAWLGLAPHPLVDPRWLASKRTDCGRRLPSPRRRARAVLRFAAGEGWRFRDPHPLFDADWYREQAGPLRGLDPLTHFLLAGEQEGLSPHPLVDPSVFRHDAGPSSEERTAEADVGEERLGRSRLTDYSAGRFLDARTHELFDGAAYREFNADVADAGAPPLEHYIRSGHAEGRRTLSPFEESWARVRWGIAKDQHFDVLALAAARSTKMIEESRRNIEAGLKADLKEFLASDERSMLGVLDDGDQPDVTVIIPVWNQAHATLGCLRALAQAADLSRFAVYVVDNGSSDPTDALLERFSGVVVTRWEENRGYGAAVNHAAAGSETEYLLLLNNDAFVDRAAIHHAREILREELDVGAVCGRIVLPNGMLQEAGSYVLPDGSSRGYLRGMPASSPSALHRRDVDFGSAAFLLIRRQLFVDLGGFDPIFGPAYGEDVDLMLRLWSTGWRTVYEPRCVITHLEGASSSNREAAERMREAARLIRTLHADVLSLRDDSEPAVPSSWAAARVGGPHVIVLDDEVPDERAGAGQPRAKDVIRELLGTGARVTLLTRGQAAEIGERSKWRDAADAISRALEVIPGLRPAQWLEVLEDRARAIDILWVSRTRNMADLRRELTSRHLGELPFPVVFDCEALDVEREAARAAQLGAPWSQQELDRRREEQFESVRFADVVTSVSEHEARIIGAAADSSTIVVGHRIERGVERSEPPAAPTVVFVGRLVESDSPNALGLQWFIDHVWPAIERGTPATLSIVGKAGRWTDHLRSDRVHVLGDVDDLAPIYRDARVCIVPTFLAAGIPHKVHMAAAHGLPTVITKLIAAQTGFVHEREALIADTEGEFVAAVARLLTDDDLWRRISSAAWERVGTDCSGETFRAGIAAALHQAAPSRFQPGPKPREAGHSVWPPPAFDPN